MILTDTSAWIDFDRANESPADLRLTKLIAADSEVAATEPVLMEVLAGARTEEAAARLRRLVTSFDWIPVDPAGDFEGAAKVYRACRRAGTTPRNLVDCMIAAIALRTGASVLSADRDFDEIAAVLPLRLDRPAP